MTIQPDLWSQPRARRHDPSTSHRAASSMRGHAHIQQTAILAALRYCPATADELDIRLAWRVTTAGRRLKELERAGLVRRTAVERVTRSGRAACVWEAVDRPTSND